MIVVLMTLLLLSGMPAQTLSDGEIQKAIIAGQTKHLDDLVSSCIATPGLGSAMAASIAGGVQPTGSFSMVAATSAGRIAILAAQAKRLYKPFARENIDDSVLRPSLFVTASPSDPERSGSSYRVGSPIEHVVLRSKLRRDVVLQPQSVEKEDVEWSNLLGGKVQGNKAVAMFELGAVRELPAGDIDVVIITKAGERTCKIGAKDRSRLMPAR